MIFLSVTHYLHFITKVMELLMHNIKQFLVNVVLLFSLISSTHVYSQSQTYEADDYTYRVVTVADGLKDPWSITFLPNGDMLFTERPGRLRIVRDGVLDPEPIAGTPTVRYQGQGGLLDVVLHPDYESNNLLYLSFSKPNAAGEGTTALVRGKYDGKRLTNVEEIFEAKAWSNGNSHFGSRVAFHPDGHLFITVGDRAVNPLSVPREQHPAQNLMLHQGKIIRLNDDGSVPEDNPFVGRTDALPEIWSYGHRNLQGLVINQETGDVFNIEHGAQGGDELNHVLPGRNYGWPVIGYGTQYGGEPIHKTREREGMMQPLHFWTPSIAPSGLLIYTGDAFPEWKGNIFVGGLSGLELHRIPLTMEDSGWRIGRPERPSLLQGFGRFRDVRQGPDGYIYVAIDDRQGGSLTPIIRLEPVQ
jgi:glucose/arabinose dehydrogenase